MSQAGSINGGGSGPPVNPEIPTSFTTDTGAAVPAANNLNVFGDNGITTVGAGDTVTIGFISGTNGTVGAATSTILTDTPDDNATTTYQILVDGFDAANSEGVGGQLIGTVRKVGGVVTVIGTPDDVLNRDAGLAGSTFTMSASGGDVIVTATGVAGRTITWKAIIAGKT